MRYFVTEQLGPKQSLTPEGFLFCEDVPIARTGIQIYGPGETVVPVGGDGIARIERLEEDVFNPDTIKSFIGKPVVNDHPDGDVTPENWRELAGGHVLNPRRGSGAMDDVLLADLMVTCPVMIQAVQDGKREVSCGYDAEYIDFGNGRGRQTKIIGNHVALVDKGRCGPRCAIGDEDTVGKEQQGMKSLKQRIKDAFTKKDECGLTAVLDELPDESGGNQPEIHNHIHVSDRVATVDKEDEEEDDKKDKGKTEDSLKNAVFADKRFTDLSDNVKKIADAVLDKDKEDEDDDEDEKKTDDEKKLEFGMEAPPGTGDKAFKVKDSAIFEESFQETLATAEIILPGVKAPTFDAKQAPGKTVDALCSFRKRVLDQAYNAQTDTHDFMDELMGGRTLDQYNCGGVRTLFQAVGVMKRKANNGAGATADVVLGPGGGTGVRGKIKSIADLNKANAERYKA